jgi:hypothetical protein
MILEERLAEWLKQPGTALSAAELQFITDMRKAARKGVGYGWMQQVIEWEWQEVHPGSAWGPEYYEKELRAQRRSCDPK